VNAAACQARNSPGRMGLFLCHERVQSFSIRNLPVNFQLDSHLENEFTELSKSILDTPRSFPVSSKRNTGRNKQKSATESDYMYSDTFCLTGTLRRQIAVILNKDVARHVARHVEKHIAIIK
jgi:hypothetical protein